MSYAWETMSIGCRNRVKAGIGLKYLVLPFLVIAAAFALLATLAGAQPAWADGEKAVDVDYAVQVQGGSRAINPSTGAIDNREELYVTVGFGETLLDDGSSGNLYINADFYLRPASAADSTQDVPVYSGSVLDEYGIGRIERADWTGGVEATAIMASFPISNVNPGTYRLVVDVSAVRWSSNDKYNIPDDEWSDPQRYIAKSADTLRVVRGTDSRPELEKATLPIASVGTAYYAKLDAAPNDMSHTLKWSAVYSEGFDFLTEWGLTLNQDGSIMGTVLSAYDLLPYCFSFNVTVYEMDGTRVVGQTTRHYNILVTDMPSIETVDVGLSRSSGGIVPGSKMSLQMKLSSPVNADATAIVHYETTDGDKTTESFDLECATAGSVIFADDGMAYVPDEASRIMQVDFVVNAEGVDKMSYELEGEDGVVAPRLFVRVDGQLDASLISPFLYFACPDSDEEYDRVWLETTDDNLEDVIEVTEIPEGAYDVSLWAYADGEQLQICNAIRVELEAGKTTDVTGQPFALGAYKSVSPNVVAPSGVGYTVNWYSDEQCSKRLGTADKRGWVNTQEVYVCAQPISSSFFGFASSEVVRITDANADSISLIIAPRASCTVNGRVTKADSGAAFALQDLRIALTLDASGGSACTWTATPDAGGNFSIAGVPVGTQANATLVVSGDVVNTAEVALDLSTASAGGSMSAGDVNVSEREGVIGLISKVNFAEVFKADGSALASTLSASGLYVYLDDPSQVSPGDVLTCKLYQGSAHALYVSGVGAYCETTTNGLSATRSATVSSQDMQRTGSLTLSVENDHEKVFGAVLVKADTKAIVRAELGNERTQIGTTERAINYTFPSVPAGRYTVVLGERDALSQLDAGDKASLGYLEDALASRGENMYVKSGEIEVEAGKDADVKLSFPNSEPNAVPISVEDSGMTMTAQGASLYYRLLIARGEAALPTGQDLNIIVNTSQSGGEDGRNGNIAGSVVYINGKAARAKNVIENYGDYEDEGDVYLLPNSVRNSFDPSDGLYVITVPAADIENGTYGDFPLAVSFSAPRLCAGSVSASASVAFGNFDWSSYHVDASAFTKGMRRSMRYRVGASELSQAVITCYAPGNVVVKDFTVYGMAPAAEDVSGDVEVYLDGAKAATVTPDAKTGLYSVQLSLGDPFERSEHSVCAKVPLADGTTASSTTSEVYYDPNTASLAKIETSTYNGDFTTSWENGQATSGHWYYLPDKPTAYRLTFAKGDGLAEEGDVHDVYVNVPRGTRVERLKASYTDEGIWMTEEYPMGNTPPTGEWVSYQATVPKAQISQGDADKIAALVDARGANEIGFIEAGKTAADYTLTTGENGDGDVFFSVSEDGKTAAFEGVHITPTASDTGAADAWVAALPTDPLDGASAEERDELVEAGYLGRWKLASTNGGLLEEDSDIGMPGANGSGVEYASAAGGTNVVYERLGVLDSTWDKMPDAFNVTGADAGKAACDIISMYPYANGDGAVYKRITVTRDKFYQGICDTKSGRVYELVNDASGEVIADKIDDATAEDESAKTEWLFNQTIVIANGWSAFYDDLVGAIHGVKPKDVEHSGLVTAGMTSQSTSSGLTLQSAMTLQMWPFSKDPPDYDNASAGDTQQALMDWVMKNGASGFADFANENYNPTGTMRGGLENRIRAKWGSEAYKELMKKVAEAAFSEAGGAAMELAGIPAFAIEAIQEGAGGAKGAYEEITGDNAREFYVACQRYEAYKAALAYMKAHPEDKKFTLDGFPFGTALPDPRKDQDDDDPKNNDDNAKKQEEGRDDDTADWPDGDDYDNYWEEQLKELEENSYRVPIPNTNQPVIDPSGYVYAGVEDNYVEGATATLFEVGEDGSRSLWGASEYGQVNPYVTDEKGKYEWFVPEGKWSVTFTKPGFRPYTTGEEDGIGAAQAGDTWYMPVAPAQLDVNINLVPTAAPEVESVEWTKAGIEVMFSQVMDAEAVEYALSLTCNGRARDFDVACVNVNREGDESDGGSNVATKAVLTPSKAPAEDEAYALTIDTSACNYGGVGLRASYPANVAVTEEALEAGRLTQAVQRANRTLGSANAAKAGIVMSANGSDVPPSTKWAPQSAFAALDAAIAALNTAMADENATSASVLAAVNDLQRATAAFQAACKAGSRSQGAAVGKTYIVGAGNAAAYYIVKEAAVGKAAGAVWYVKPKVPKKLTSVTVPDVVTIAGLKYKVTGISAKAFAKCAKLKKATVGNNVEIISAGAFGGCKKLSKLTIGASVKTIGKGVCKKCKKLKMVTVKSGLLNKASCKNFVKGSKVKKVKLAGAAKKMKKTYKKYFPKKVKVS